MSYSGGKSAYYGGNTTGGGLVYDAIKRRAGRIIAAHPERYIVKGGSTSYYGGKTAKQQQYQNVIKSVMAQGMTLKQALIHIKKNNLYKK